MASFSFTLSTDALTIAPNASATVTVTQVADDGVSATYRISNQNAGWDDATAINEEQTLTGTWGLTNPNSITITGNGTATLTLSVSDDAEADEIATTIYGIATNLPTENGFQPVVKNQPITITIEA